MSLSRETLTQHLNGRPFLYFDSIGSTNDAARNWLLNDAKPGACVIADEQTSGRGRKTRAWHTPPGTALAVSVILRPPPAAVHQVIMMGALAVAETVDGLDSWGKVEIKWPNDVLLNGKKVSGVLAEAAWKGDQLQGVVLGMGINVRVDFTGTPLESTAISIESALGGGVNRTVLLAVLLRRIDHWTKQLGTQTLFLAWKARLGTLGKTITMAGESGDLTGVAESVEPNGTLLLRTPDDTLHRIVAGDITQASRT